MSKELDEIVYTPESELHKPGNLARSMLRDLMKSRELAWRLFVRNISSKYRQTFLGYFWAFIPVIFTTLTFVFLSSKNIVDIGATDIPYPAYVMSGVLLWQIFVESLNSPLKIVNQSKTFITKINFPKEALIIAGIGEVLFNFFIRLILLICIYIWFDIPVPSTIIIAPLGIISLITLGIVIGMFIVPFGMIYQDIEKGLILIVSIWFFLTPVVYPMPSGLNESVIILLNPVTILLETTREMLFSGSISRPVYFFFANFVLLILLIFSWLLYRLAFPHLIERMNT